MMMVRQVCSTSSTNRKGSCDAAAVVVVRVIRGVLVVGCREGLIIEGEGGDVWV